MRGVLLSSCSSIGWSWSAPFPNPIAGGHRIIRIIPQPFPPLPLRAQRLLTPSSSSSSSSSYFSDPANNLNNCNKMGSVHNHNEQREEELKRSPEEKPPLSPPPPPTKTLEPPEKPLPGDCCGSGCVRCVWDIYYEELEDYNNSLSNSNSFPPSNQ